MQIPAYVLAGGRSSRFGSDKARAPARGATLIEHVCRALRPVAEPITIVAERAAKYADLGLATIADRIPGLGPLGGLYTALLHCGHDWLLLASCDWLGLRADWARLLLDARRADVHAVAFKGERWEPLFALYHRAALPLVESELHARQLAMWRLIERLPHTAVPLPPDWPLARQGNTPQDLGAENSD